MKNFKCVVKIGSQAILRLAMILTLLIVIIKAYGQNELDVIANKWLEYSDAPNALYHHLTSEAYKYLEQREDAISSIKSLAEWQQRQKWIRETMSDIIGPFPGKSPLNAKIVRTILKDNYRIEHIIFESQPGFYVTSSLFIPKGLKKGIKAPAIIYCSGHTVEGYRSPVYQHVILNLVRKGFIVFAFDPVGQGERLEYYDPVSGKSIIGGPTKEHSYPGAQAFITGSSQARYMIWDGIRAVDYLLLRKEVDPARIGITGRSGGGTQSAYISAIDERIYAAAPENYLTNYTRLLQTAGPQDAEQNLFNLIKRGLDHPDFLIVRAPKPTLFITTTRDMFSIQGTIETEKEVSEVYKAYGKKENFSRIEDDTIHASTKKNREAMYAFFQNNLNNPGNPYDEETIPLTTEELRVTNTGQVSTSLNGETVFSINKREAEDRENKLNILRVNPGVYLPHAISAARKLSGYLEPSMIEKPVFTGRFQRNNYVIEQYFLKGEGDYVIPYLLFIPQKPDSRAMIYLNPLGKSAGASVGGEIERFVEQGITVIAPDLIGIGEMGPGALRGDAYFNGVSHNLWYASMLIGRSITGVQAGDVVRLVMLLKQNNKETQICGFARKEMASVLLHAAAFTPEIGSVILFEPYSSYLSIVKNRYYNPLFIHGTVPGSLREYDLPDLESSLAPRKLFIKDTTDGSGNTNDTLSINKDLAIVNSAYCYMKVQNQLKIITGGPDEQSYKLLMDFIK